MPDFDQRFAYYENLATRTQTELTDMERERQLDIEAAYPFRHVVVLPLKIARVLGCSQEKCRDLVGNLDGYIQALDTNRYVAQIGLNLTLPRNGNIQLRFMTTTREVGRSGVDFGEEKLFVFNIPCDSPLSKAQATRIASAIIQTFLDRDVTRDMPSHAQWGCSEQFDSDYFKPASIDELLLEMTEAILNNGHVKLLRFLMLVIGDHTTYNARFECWSPTDLVWKYIRQ